MKEGISTTTLLNKKKEFSTSLSPARVSFFYEDSFCLKRFKRDGGLPILAKSEGIAKISVYCRIRVFPITFISY